MRIKKSEIALLLFCLLLSNKLCSTQIRGGGLVLDIDTQKAVIRNIKAISGSKISASGTGGISVLDGLKEQKLEFSPPAIRKNKNNLLKYSCSEKGGSLLKTVEYAGDKNQIDITVGLKNSSSTQRLLEIQIGIPLDLTGDGWKYWDGGDFYDYGKKKPRHWKGEDFTVKVNSKSNVLAVNADPVIRYQPHNFRTDNPGHSPGIEAWYIFPCTSIYNEKTGLALGINPKQILSYHSGGVQPKINSERAFFYGTKIVLEPGQSLEVKFVMFAFEPEFGWRNTIGKFYELYPECFSLRKDVDQRITGPCGGHWSACVGWLIGEQQRRLRRQWTWYYAPFLMTGVTFPLPENWNPTRLNATLERIRNYRKNIPYERFIHSIIDAVTEMHRYVAVGFYVYNWRADYYAAKHYYPDAIVSRAEVKRNKKDRNNIAYSNVLAKGAELLVSVSPFNPDFFKFTVNNFKKIAEIYKPDGIAFDDCTGASPYYFDKHAYHAAGRTFSKFFSYGHVFGDKKLRIMVRRGAAARLLGNEVHKLKNRDGKTLFVAANSPNDYLSCTTADVAVQERVRSAPVIPADKANKNKLWGLGLRRMMGSKPISLLIGYRGEKFSKRDLDLYCLYIGATRSTEWNAEGIKMAEYQSVLSKAGWQAVPATKTASDILASRFGHGLETYIVAINRSAKIRNVKLKIINKYIGKKRYVFCGHHGEKLKNKLTGNNSEVEVKIPAEGFFILKPVACTGTGNSNFSIWASCGNDKVVLEAEKEISCPFTVKLPKGVEILNSGSFDKKGNNVVLKYLKGKTVVPFIPQVVFLTPPEKISKFPFYNKNIPAASVVFPDNKLIPDKKIVDTTIELSAFFGYYNAFKRLRNNYHQIMYQANLYPVIQTKMPEWLEPREPAIVVSEDTSIPVPEKVVKLLKNGHGVIFSGMVGKRPVLYILARDETTRQETIRRLLVSLEPFFPAFKWEY